MADYRGGQEFENMHARKDATQFLADLESVKFTEKSLREQGLEDEGKVVEGKLREAKKIYSRIKNDPIVDAVDGLAEAMKEFKDYMGTYNIN